MLFQGVTEMFRKFTALVFSTFFIITSVSMANSSVKEKSTTVSLPAIIIGSGKFKACGLNEQNDSLVFLAKTAQGYYVHKKTCDLCEIQDLPRIIMPTDVMRNAIDARLKETIYEIRNGKEVKRIKPTHVTIRYGENEHDYIGSFKITLKEYTSNEKVKILYFDYNTMTNQKGEKPKFEKTYFFSVCVDYPPIAFP